MRLSACGDAGSSAPTRHDHARRKSSPRRAPTRWPSPRCQAPRTRRPPLRSASWGSAARRSSNVSVVGSHSGNHPGKLSRYSTFTGASFVPTSRFPAGEQVAVHALVGPSARTPNKPVTSVFTVAHQASVSQAEFPKEPGDSKRSSTMPRRRPIAPARSASRQRPRRAQRRATCSSRPIRGSARPAQMIAEQNGTPRLVSPVGEERLLHQLPRAGIRRQAGADVVAGADPAASVSAKEKT